MPTGDFPFGCNCIPECVKHPQFHEPPINPELEKQLNTLVKAIRLLEETKEISNTERMNWIEQHPNSLLKQGTMWFSVGCHWGYSTAAEAIDQAIRAERADKSIG